MEKLDEFFFKWRNVLAALPLLAALTDGPWRAGSPLVLWLVGIAVAVAGVKLRALCVCFNKYAQREKKSLATTGPYGVIRNPLYVGNALVILGAAIASRHLWLVPVLVVWCALVYARVAAHEERRLAARYGDAFRAYREAVPAWIPRPPEGFYPALIRQSASLALLIPFLLLELLGR